MIRVRPLTQHHLVLAALASLVLHGVLLAASWNPAQRASAAAPIEMAFEYFEAKPAPVVPPAPAVAEKPAPMAKTRAVVRRAPAQPAAPAPTAPATVETKQDVPVVPEAPPVFHVRLGPPVSPPAVPREAPAGEGNGSATASRLPDADASLLRDVRISYPAAAQAAGVEGTVKLELSLDAEGRVVDAVVLRGPGYGLDDAAREAVKRFVFKPAIRNGKPAPSKLKYAYTFVLE